MGKREKGNLEEKGFHWADKTAKRIIEKKGNKKEYVIAAGITPSGTVHAGNFREVITVDLVRRGLVLMGKKVRFIYSWDDYDVFRKVPKNMPKQELLFRMLRKPISIVPDVYGCHKSYAEHNEKEFEKYLPVLGIKPEFIYQHKEYMKCKYSEEIKKALEKKEKIKKILNKFRKEPLSKEWLPVVVFCSKCNKDTTKAKYLGDYKVYYECSCGNKEEFDIREKGIIKLRWRVDWPMRWHFYKEDFEPAGKDHFAAGGSIITSRMIEKEVYGTESPEGFMYEWISIKGHGQFSSSKGIVVTLKELLEVYEPEIIRYLFASTRPNVEFAISFDLDVLKIYEDFDKCERIYFKTEKAKNEKEFLKQKRIYELSMIEMPEEQPIQPGFRHLTTLVQLYKDFKKVKGYFKEEIKNGFDLKRLKIRYECAKNWLSKYAPENMKFSLQEEPKIKLKAKEKEIIEMLKQKLQKLQRLKEKIGEKGLKDIKDKELHAEFYEISKQVKAKPEEFFKTCYRVLINKDRGPRLARFILTIGIKKVIEIFEKALKN